MRFFKLFLILLVGFILTGCHGQNQNTIRVGTVAGPQTQLLQLVKQIAKEKYDLNVVIVEYADDTQPNAALADGNIDANIFQHKLFLDQQIKEHNYKFIPIGKTFIFPMGLYSTKVKDISQVPLHGVIAIPSDPSNRDRALLLLQKSGLIQLNENVEVNATPADIAVNPKQVTFKEYDQGQIASHLNQVSLGAINTNYAIKAGLSPAKNAIFLEAIDSPYVNLIVIREDDKDQPKFKNFISAFQSKEVKEEAKRIFNDQAIAAWE